MRIVVLMKRVPDTETRIRIASSGTSLDPEGVRYVANPYDEFALEAALRLRDGVEGSEVTVLTLGDDPAQEMLRGALALGADRAVLLRGEGSLDGLATAKALLPEIRSLDPDLLLLGVRAVDDDQEQVGPMLATLLGWPCATSVARFDHEDRHVVCVREIEGGSETVRLPLAAALTITKGAYEPRHPSLKGIMAAKRKPLEVREAPSVPARVRVIEMKLPAERTGARFVGEGPDAVPDLVQRLRDEAGVL